MLKVDKRRWDVSIAFRLADGTERTMIASADAYFTDHDGIWWDTAEETAEYEG